MLASLGQRAREGGRATGMRIGPDGKPWRTYQSRGSKWRLCGCEEAPGGRSRSCREDGPSAHAQPDRTMIRRVAGRSPPGHRAHPPAAPTNAVQGWWSWGWKRATTAILTVGALAAAIGAVVSLWPSPDPEDTAQFTTIRTFPGVPLSEYRQRQEVVDGAQKVGLRSFRVGPSASPETTQTQASDSTATTDEPTETTSESAASETTTSRRPRSMPSSGPSDTATSITPPASSEEPPPFTSTMPIVPAGSAEGFRSRTKCGRRHTGHRSTWPASILDYPSATACVKCAPGSTTCRTWLSANA